MADGTAASTLAPAPAAALSPEAGAQQAVSGMQAAAAQEREVAKKGAAEIDTLQKQTTARVQSFDDIISRLKPPELGTPPPKPTYTQTTPIQAWGSAAMLAAAVGSLFTRTPLRSAMNAAAAGLNAFHQGDIDRANAQFEQWKVDMDNYYKLYDHQMDIYKSILGEYMDREKIAADLGDQQIKTKIAEMTAVSSALGDTLMANSRSLDAMLHIMEERDRLTFQLQTSGEKIVSSQALESAVAAYDKDHPEGVGPNSTPEGRRARLAYIGQVRAQVDHSLTPSQSAHLVESTAKSVATSDPGKAYSAAVRNYQTIAAWPPGGGVIPQAALQDAYTQLINGGRAIRGFQAKMNTEHAGLFDKVDIALQQALAHGGNLSPQMIADIQFMSKQILKERVSTFQQALTDSSEVADSLGLDGNEVEKQAYGLAGRLTINGQTFMGGDLSNPQDWQKAP